GCRAGRVAHRYPRSCVDRQRRYATRRRRSTAGRRAVDQSEATTLWNVSTALSTHIFMRTFSLCGSLFGVPLCVSFGANSPWRALPGYVHMLTRTTCVRLPPWYTGG